MRHGQTDHRNHIERKCRAWNRRTDPTERELEVLHAMQILGPCAMSKLSANLGITRGTAHQLRESLIALQLLDSTGYGATRRVVLSDRGRAVLSLENHTRTNHEHA